MSLRIILNKPTSINFLRFPKIVTNRWYVADQPPNPESLSTSIKRNILQRQEPGKVHLGFIPHEWFMFFVPKTGYTGFYTFLFTFSTYLISKEHYVLEENFYGGLSMAIMWTVIIKKTGPHMANYLDKEIDQYEQHLINGDESVKKQLLDNINEEKKNQWRSDGQLLLLQAKRRNVILQIEAEMRKRQFTVYEEIKKRLDYELKVAHIQERFLRMNRLDWIFKEVKKSVQTAPDEIRGKVLTMSITDVAKIIDKTLLTI